VKKFSKMLGAGGGSAVALIVAFALRRFLPDIDEQTTGAIQFLIYRLLESQEVVGTAGAMVGSYVAPPNKK
jgi:hypothetical protein